MLGSLRKLVSLQGAGGAGPGQPELAPRLVGARQQAEVARGEAAEATAGARAGGGRVRSAGGVRGIVSPRSLGRVPLGTYC